MANKELTRVWAPHKGGLRNVTREWASEGKKKEGKEDIEA